MSKKDKCPKTLVAQSRRRFIGNCPECGFDANSASKYTPRHGHIKWGERWLPACPGSGQELENIQEIKK